MILFELLNKILISFHTETLLAVDKRLAFYKVSKLVVEDVSTCIEKSLRGNDATNNNILSSFLEPSEVFAVTDAFNSVPRSINLKYLFHGGHKEAEYRRVLLRNHKFVPSSDNRYGQVQQLIVFEGYSHIDLS